MHTKFVHVQWRKAKGISILQYFALITFPFLQEKERQRVWGLKRSRFSRFVSRKYFKRWNNFPMTLKWSHVNVDKTVHELEVREIIGLVNGGECTRLLVGLKNAKGRLWIADCFFVWDHSLFSTVYIIVAIGRSNHALSTRIFKGEICKSGWWNKPQILRKTVFQDHTKHAVSWNHFTSQCLRCWHQQKPELFLGWMHQQYIW